MADASVPMTSKGYQFLVEELKRLKSVERPKNVREIEEARERAGFQAFDNPLASTSALLRLRVAVSDDRSGD